MGSALPRVPAKPLRQAIAAEGIAHDLLADALGIERSTLRNHIEHGEVTNRFAARVCVLLGVDPRHLWGAVWIEPAESFLGRMFEPMPWRAFAACRDVDPDLFFGPKSERPERRILREAHARAICARCPVLEVCRDYARRNREHGYWGGESEEERAAAGYRAAVG